MRKNAIKVICDEAKRESEIMKKTKFAGHYFAGDRYAKSTENINFVSPALKKCVRLDSEPVCLENFTPNDSNIRTTAGWFSVRYVPSNSFKRIQSKPFVIGQDLIRMKVACASFEHWLRLSRDIPELNWIAKWCSTLDKDLFDLCAQHPGIEFYFTPDWVRYANHIRERAKQLHLDLDNRVFMNHVMSKEKQDYLEENFPMAPLKTHDDYRREVFQADREFDIHVRREMRQMREARAQSVQENNNKE